MRRLKQLVVLLLTVFVAFSGFSTVKTQAAVNDYVTVTKTVSPTTITTEETADVTLNVTGTPPVNVIVPNDVVLVIDKSGSMVIGEDKMTNAKNAAKGFIDLMDMSKHRVAVVDFSTSSNSFPFTTDKDAAKNYIDGIQASGSTATGDAVQKAIDILADHRPEAQPVIVIMTDGAATVGSPDPFTYAVQKAQEAKDQGIIFYTIALLLQNDNPDSSQPNIVMKEMATTSAHHHFVLGSTGLNEIYAAIVKEIGLASAFDVTVTDTVGPGFEIVPGSADNNIPKPTINGNTLTWQFNELKNSTLAFNYKIRPVDKTKAGTFPASTTSSVINYKDYAGASRSKAIPVVNVTVKLPAPHITSLEANSGNIAGGETVTINGDHFISGATVKFGTAAAQNVVFVSDTQIKVTAPAGSQGTINVSVTNPDGQSATSPYQYKADPVVSVMSPNKGPLAGGTSISVTGQYFLPGIQVKFGEKTGTIVGTVSKDFFTVTSPSADVAGPVDVTFTNPDGSSTVVPAGFTYLEPPKMDPEITSISPSTGLITGGTTAYISGKNFKADLKVYIGGKLATSVFESSTELRVTIPAGDAAGAVDVSVEDTNQTRYTLPLAYTYTVPVQPTPTITSMTPTSGLVTGGNTVFIDGNNFVTGVTKVIIGGKEAVTTIFSKMSLSFKVPAGDGPGKVDVKVVNDTKEAVLVNGYEYTLPVVKPVTITLVTPNKGKTTGGDTLTITGTNFMTGVKVTIGGADASAVYQNATTISAKAPAGAVGKADVTVTNTDGGTATLSGGYEYVLVSPTISVISPNHGAMRGGDTIFVNGTNFVTGTTITINGVPVTGLTITNATSLYFTTPASATSGTFPLVLTHPNGQSVTRDFIYDAPAALPAPKITTMSPGTGKVGTTVFIDGSNYVANSVIYFGTVPAATTYSSKSSLYAKVPAGVTGTVDVTVVNPDGQVSNVKTFTVT